MNTYVQKYTKLATSGFYNFFRKLVLLIFLFKYVIKNDI